MIIRLVLESMSFSGSLECFPDHFWQFFAILGLFEKIFIFALGQFTRRQMWRPFCSTKNLLRLLFPAIKRHWRVRWWFDYHEWMHLSLESVFHLYNKLDKNQKKVMCGWKKSACNFAKKLFLRVEAEWKHVQKALEQLMYCPFHLQMSFYSLLRYVMYIQHII